MLDIIDSADSTDCLVPELPTATPESHDQLGEAITSLWIAHANAKIDGSVNLIWPLLIFSFGPIPW